MWLKYFCQNFCVDFFLTYIFVPNKHFVLSNSGDFAFTILNSGAGIHIFHACDVTQMQQGKARYQTGSEASEKKTWRENVWEYILKNEWKSFFKKCKY